MGSYKSCHTPNPGVDCFVDANFAGLFSVEQDKHAPISLILALDMWLCIAAHFFTGFLILAMDMWLYCSTPLFLVSNMQTQITLITMEAEHVALLQSMHNLIHILEVLKEIMVLEFSFKPSISYHSHGKAFMNIDIRMIKYTIHPSEDYEEHNVYLKIRMPNLSPTQNTS